MTLDCHTDGFTYFTNKLKGASATIYGIFEEISNGEQYKTGAWARSYIIANGDHMILI